jgi:formate hydrogenlyase transcriptional activator
MRSHPLRLRLETVSAMARAIEYYVPEKFRKQSEKWIQPEQHGKIIPFPAREWKGMKMSTAGFEVVFPRSSVSEGFEDPTQNACASEPGIMGIEFSSKGKSGGIIGSSPALQSVLEEVKRVAPTDSTVLILGDTGTGKEVISQAIHNLSARCGRPFIRLSCAALPFDLLESELFGHEKGAFTGAIAQKIGRFEMADRGTLFLDEVGDIPLALQPKLLRVLQEQQFERLGSGRTHQVDVRLIAATNRNLNTMIAQGQFRSDLYYRLNVFPILLPPLRERREDIPVLVTHFVKLFSRRMGKQVPSIPPETMAAFQWYSWPGNIRELQNLVERAVILSRDGVLPNPLHKKQTEPMFPCLNRTRTFHPSMTSEDSDRALILEKLDQSRWIVGGPRGAAAKLGLKRTTLLSRMGRLGISRPIPHVGTDVRGMAPEGIRREYAQL